MENKETKPKSVWNDISRIWGRIAAVIAAVGVSATCITKIFNTSPELTYSVFAALGLILLIISFYVDKQTQYLHEEIVQYEQQARNDFTDAMHKTKDEMTKMKQDTNQRVDQLSQNIDKILELSKETRKDNVRIQLLMIMEHQPENVDTILKIAEKYFIKLKGDWYMTNEFSKWAKEHNVTIPAHLYDVIDNNNNHEE